MKPAMWSVPLVAAIGGFVGAVLACYQITGDLMSPAAAITGHLRYVASVTGEFGAVFGIASALLSHFPQ